MSKIYFNNPIIKHLKETTILNFFSEKDGKSIFIRDIRPDIYRDQLFVYGELSMYSSLGDYYVDILPMKVMSGEVYGVYVGEGYDFEVSTEKEPVFIVRQKSTIMALGMMPGMHQGSVINETALGMFHVGTTITFKRDGVQIKDELTKNGWMRRSGPSDKDFGIMTVEEAFVKKIAKSEKEQTALATETLESIARIKKAKDNGEINPVLADELIASKTDTNEKNIYMFLASDIRDLKKRKIL